MPQSLPAGQAVFTKVVLQLSRLQPLEFSLWDPAYRPCSADRVR
jgi:hypothetical protein